MIKIAVSSGDTSGIGPDICIKDFTNFHSMNCCPIIFGNINLFKERAEMLKTRVEIEEYKGEEVSLLKRDKLWIVNSDIETTITPGKPDIKAAKYIIETFKNSVKRTLKKEFSAVVTCPINKELINEAGISFTGHTEELANISGAKKVVMMLVNEKLKIALATTHIPLNQVSSSIDQRHLEEVISIVNNALENYWGIKCPLIKVLGLNPHAGDGGYIGKEENEIIEPVITKLNKKGLNLKGPISADTAFIEKNEKIKADSFIAMFHDQGLPVIKSLGFGETVNITLGLPFVRTSVDHGTAYDISGSGKADESSLITAIKMASLLSQK